MGVTGQEHGARPRKSCGICHADLSERSRIKLSDDDYRCRPCERRRLARTKLLTRLRRLGLWALLFAVAVALTVAIVGTTSLRTPQARGGMPFRK